MNTNTGINHKSQRTDKCLSSLTWPWEIFLMGDTPGKNLGKPDDPVPVLVMLQKQGWSTSCYASTRRINSCMQSSKANREIDRKTSRCWTNRKMWIPQIPTPRKASCSVLVHNSAHHLPWIDHWMEARTCSWRDASCCMGPVLWDLHT